MGKEVVLEGSPIPLETLAHQTEEEWSQNWQDLKFTKYFPKLVPTIVSSPEWQGIPDKDKKVMTGRSTRTLVMLP